MKKEIKHRVQANLLIKRKEFADNAPFPHNRQTHHFH